MAYMPSGGPFDLTVTIIVYATIPVHSKLYKYIVLVIIVNSATYSNKYYYLSHTIPYKHIEASC